MVVTTTGNDTVSGEDSSTTSLDTYQDTDQVVDTSTTDSDTYNLTLLAAGAPKATNIENINVSMNSLSP